MESAISVTEAARNFAEVINRAYYRHETTTLLKNGKRVGRIVPAGPSMRTGKEIPAEMSSTRPRLGAEEAKAFDADLLAARAEMPMPVSRWD